MKIHRRFLQYVGGVLAIAALTGPAQAAVTLPSSAALPTNSVSNRGFVVRTAQASTSVTVANSFIRALRQINGILVDEGGLPVANVAIPGPQPDGFYFNDYITFERDANAPVSPKDTDGVPQGGFFSEPFPGIPGNEGETTQFADESVALVVLEPGVYHLAIAANADRTDVNDDDGCSVFVGANPRDFFATKIADFGRTAGTAAFGGNQYIENQIEVVVPVRGAYPFRLLHWQQGRGANLQFYVVDTNTTARWLINDNGSDPATPLAYRSSSAAAYNAPYIADITPAPGSAGNSSQGQLTVILFDGTTTVTTASIELSINGAPVVPVKVKSGAKTTVAYLPVGGWTTPNNTVTLIYADSSTALHTNTWSFSVNVAGGSTTQVKGQWDFENGDLAATVGTALRYFDPTFDGPTGSSANKTTFGTTASFGLPPINGQIANVMQVPGDLTRRLGYVMTHGIAPNGGGTLVNQYTLIMDIFATNNNGAASLIQINSVNNTDDGDLFWQGANVGQGGGDGYAGYGALTAGTWHRLVVAYDEAANPPRVTKFVDGVKQDDWTSNQGLDNPRRSLLPTAILFGDGDQDERRTMWVNSIQIRAGKLSDAEMVALGGPEACGIPATIPQSSVTGQWDFNNSDLRATIGANLTYFDPTFDGPTGSTGNPTTFGTTTSFGIPNINGQEANVMQVPGDLTRQLGYVMTHGIAPNGGGTLVNQYTLIMDIFATNNNGAASLIQINSVNNTDDGDLFWQGANFGQGGGDGYAGYGALTAGTWHRLVAAYDEAASPPRVTKYVDGIKQDEWTSNQGLDNPRRALLPTAILFGDGDQDERRTMWVNSIQIRAGAMSDADIVQLGGPSAGGIPVVVPHSSVTGQWEFNNGDLRANIGAALAYFDPTFDGPTGSTANPTTFGTTTSFGIVDINGQEASVMQVPGDLTRQLGYVMTHGIPPNGGGSLVNQYTLVMDLFATNNNGAASLIQINSVNNTDDGDLFWQGANVGQGGGDGYAGTGQLTAGSWHRLALAYNEAASPPAVTKYVDGIFQDDWTSNQGLDAPRRALLPTAILFGDGDQDERRTMWVNSIQIRAGALSKNELAALGTPVASGIPVHIPVEPPVSLCWGKIGNGITLIWPLSATGYTLKSAPTVDGPWSAVSGVVNNSVVVTIGPGNEFFRLEK